jgi:hypothetical protein
LNIDKFAGISQKACLKNSACWVQRFDGSYIDRVEHGKRHASVAAKFELLMTPAVITKPNIDRKLQPTLVPSFER